MPCLGDPENWAIPVAIPISVKSVEHVLFFSFPVSIHLHLLMVGHDEEDAVARTAQGHQVKLPAGRSVDCEDGGVSTCSYTFQLNYCQGLADPCSL